MLTRDFDYELPAAAIAQQAAPRGASRLLVLDAAGEERHRSIADLPGLLRRGDLLVVNDTRVLAARLFGRRVAAGEAGTSEAGAGEGGAGEGGAGEGGAGERALGARIELLLAERHGEHEWDVLCRPGKRARLGTVIELETRTGAVSGITAAVLAAGADGRRRVRLSHPIEDELERLGHVPLPPYIRRPRREAGEHGDSGERGGSTSGSGRGERGDSGAGGNGGAEGVEGAEGVADRERYQTVYAERPGSIAAPTAGLHFSAPLLAALEAAGIERVAVTLHVGLGTFKPVTALLVSEHHMDREHYEISQATADAIARARADGRRIVAVGTTVVRCLESAALAAGEGATAGQSPIPVGAGSTNLFITPGFRFQVVDVLLTNFHLPRSTLLMLVSAFAGRDRVLAGYREAIGREYRFYSYGDAMLAQRAALEG